MRLGARKRLDEMLGHMKERIVGKIGNQNNNAFKLRKLFAMYDMQKTGLVRSCPPPAFRTPRTQRHSLRAGVLEVMQALRKLWLAGAYGPSACRLFFLFQPTWRVFCFGSGV